MRTRIEITFSSGKFIAYPSVKTSSIHYNTNHDLCFLVNNDKYDLNKVIVKMDKVDFVEFFENEEETTE